MLIALSTALTWVVALLYTVLSIVVGSDKRRFVALWPGGVAAAVGGLGVALVTPLPKALSGGSIWHLVALSGVVFFANGYFLFQVMPARPSWRLAAVTLWSLYTVFDLWGLAQGLASRWTWRGAGEAFVADFLLFGLLIAVYESLDIRARLQSSKQKRGLWSWSWPLFAGAGTLIRLLSARAAR